MNISFSSDYPSEVFIVAFIPCFLLMIIQMGVFFCLRKRFSRIYNPRGLYNLGPFNQEYLNLNNREWLSAMLSMDDKKVFNHTGIDGLLMVRFSRLLVILSLVVMMFGLIFILPIHLTGDMGMEDFFNQASLSNISTKSDRLWSHLVFLWLFSFIIYGLIWREWSVLTKYKKLNDMNDKYQSNSFIVCQYNRECSDFESDNSSNENRLQDSVNSIVEANSYTIHTFPYLDNFMRLINNHDRLVMKLHQCKWDQNLEVASSLKVSSLLSQLKKNYDMLQQEQKCNHELTDTSVILFKKPTKCLSVKNSLNETCSYYNIRCIDPSSIIIKNTTVSFNENMIRSFIINLLMIGFLMLWIGPLTGIVSLTKLESLTRQFSYTTTENIPDVLFRFCEGLLPIIIMGIIYLFLVKLLYFVESFKRVISRDRLDLLVCRDMIIFMIIDSFLFFVISGSVLENLKEIFEKPFDIPLKLAAALPSQSSFFIVQIMAYSFVLHPWEMIRLLRYPFVYKFPFMKYRSDLKCTLNTLPEEPYYPQLYARYILIYTVGITYSLLSPMILPFWFLYFVSGHIEMVFNVTHIHEASYSYRGKFWLIAYNGLMIGLFIAQLMMIGVMTLRKNVLIAALCGPLPFISLAVWLFLRKKYLKKYCGLSVELTKKMPELNDHSIDIMLKSYIYHHEIPKINELSKFKYPFKYRLETCN